MKLKAHFKTIGFISFILVSNPVQAQSRELPEGCFSGRTSVRVNGDARIDYINVKIAISKINSGLFEIDEVSTLTNEDSNSHELRATSYEVKRLRSSSRIYIFRGKQNKLLKECELPINNKDCKNIARRIVAVWKHPTKENIKFLRKIHLQGRRNHFLSQRGTLRPSENEAGCL